MINLITMVEYSFDRNGIKILESAIHYLEYEMTGFENKKELMGTQTRMQVQHTGELVDRLCAILPKLPACKLTDNTDISGAYMSLVAYKKGIETTLMIKQKADKWVFNPTELQSKIRLIEHELQVIDNLFGVPQFVF